MGKKKKRKTENSFKHLKIYLTILALLTLTGIGIYTINASPLSGENQKAIDTGQNRHTTSNRENTAPVEIEKPAGQDVKTIETNLLKKHGIMSFRPSDIMSDPMTLMDVWLDEPMPLRYYTDNEIKTQKDINKKSTTCVLAYYPEPETDYPDNYRLPMEERTIDNEAITPYTWKWVFLEIAKEDGSISKIQLRRPHWWLKYYEADKVGSTLWLTLLEMGIEGEATVTKVRPNQFDSRFHDIQREGDYAYLPTTGFFEHESNDIWHFYFTGADEPTGGTSNHPFRSITRNDWIPAGSLEPGEQVKTKEGKIVTFSHKTKVPGRQKVYNLEIYRAHTYHVGKESILVHNSCAGKGQVHHLISKKVSNILKEHKTLKGLINRENPALKYAAKDLASHKGYQTWHRAVDNEVAKWLIDNPAATQNQFYNFLNSVYQRPDIAARIPGVNIPVVK